MSKKREGLLPKDRFVHERQVLRQVNFVAGGDEAGRGPWAGPVSAALVILNPDKIDPRINDSKKLTPEIREELSCIIKRDALAFGIGFAQPDEIDRLNILEATRLAFVRAWEALPMKPDYILFDAIRVDGILCPQEPLIRGDSRSFSIAAASILAKVARDLLLMELDARFPRYGFCRHKGYGTPEHQAALKKWGPCPSHRKSFRPVREIIQKGGPEHSGPG
jgi:ribonuclease HII